MIDENLRYLVCTEMSVCALVCIYECFLTQAQVKKNEREKKESTGSLFPVLPHKTKKTKKKNKRLAERLTSA